jgi:hypothetical protein
MLMVTVVMFLHKTKDIFNLWSFQEYRRKTILKIYGDSKRKILLQIIIAIEQNYILG